MEKAPDLNCCSNVAMAWAHRAGRQLGLVSSDGPWCEIEAGTGPPLLRKTMQVTVSGPPLYVSCYLCICQALGGPPLCVMFAAGAKH